MLSRFSEVLQTAADVLAPPATRLVDFQYHWMLIQHFYISENMPTRVHVENTKIPLHLHQMLQFMVDEEAEGTISTEPPPPGPCLLQLTEPRIGLASCLATLAETDRPPGLRGAVLAWFTALLRRVKGAPVHEPALLRPIQKLLITCHNNHASPTEKEEVELLLTLCGLVRKQPSLAYLFLSASYDDGLFPGTSTGTTTTMMRKPKKNKLFDFDTLPVTIRQVSIISQPEEVTGVLPPKDIVENGSVSSSSDENRISNKSCGNSFDENEKFLLIDLLFSYLSSADNHIILRACEGIMIVASLPDDRIAHLIANTSTASEYLIDILIDKYKMLPADTDPCDIDQLNITWGYASQEFAERCERSVGLRETTSFLSWLDYCDTLAKECHVVLAVCLARTLRWHFLAAELELGLAGRQHAVLVTTVVGKCLKAIDSAELLNEISRWLVGDCANVTVRPPSPVLQTLINNCFEGGMELCLETLRLFETMLEKGSEHIMHCLMLGFVNGRGYHSPPRSSYHPEDEERDRLNAQTLQQERESNRHTIKMVSEGCRSNSHAVWPEGGTYTTVAGSQTMAPSNIHKVINSFLLLLPRNLLSDPGGLGYEQYMQDAHRHYLGWVETTAGFNWPKEAIWHDPGTSSVHSCDSRPEADLHMNSPCTSYQSQIPSPERRNTHTVATETSNCKDSADDNVFLDESSHEEKPHSNLEEKGKRIDYKKSHSAIETGNPSKATQSKRCDLVKLCSFDTGTDDIDNHSECISHSFHQQLVLSQRDRCSLSEMAEDEEMTFDEGPFFRTLFKLMANMHNQPYQINLQLTAIFSKLAMMPHPYLHEYLLNPVLPSGKNVQTLFKTLQKLVKIFLSLIPKVKSFDVIIAETRQRLLGDDSSDDNDNVDPLFESLIVVEEFCKELAAISFVKYHHSSQQLGI